MADGYGQTMARGAVRIGCSGWSYKDWRGVVYPEKAPSRTWFDHYTELFDTVELNTTFYRLPTRERVEGWRDQAPEGFCFAAKLGQFCTHRMKLRDPAGWLPNHLDRIERLGPHLGPNLVQLPPRWKRDTGRLAEFLELAPRHIRWAVELRDPSWVHDDVFELLAEHDAALCIHDLIADHPVLLTADWTYLRFHGPNAIEEPYQHRYGTRRLRRITPILGEWLDDGIDLYAYFNNDWHGNAVTDATTLRRELTG